MKELAAAEWRGRIATPFFEREERGRRRREEERAEGEGKFQVQNAVQGAGNRALLALNSAAMSNDVKCRARAALIAWFSCV